MSKYTCALAQGEAFHDGMIKSIKCPCDCYEVTDVILNNADGTNIGVFQLIDANGDPTAGVGNVWAAGMYIQVRFDLSTLKAQVLNGANSAKAKEHTHAASAITAGTFAGQVVANASGQTPGTKLIRNSKLMEATAFDAVTDWSSHITNGEIVWRYE